MTDDDRFEGQAGKKHKLRCIFQGINNIFDIDLMARWFSESANYQRDNARDSFLFQILGTHTQDYLEMLIFVRAKAVKAQAPLAKKHGISGGQKCEMQGTLKVFKLAACEFKQPRLFLLNEIILGANPRARTQREKKTRNIKAKNISIWNTLRSLRRDYYR